MTRSIALKRSSLLCPSVSVYLSIYLSVCLSARPPAHTIYLSVFCPSVRPSLSLYIYIAFYLFVRAPARSPVPTHTHTHTHTHNKCMSGFMCNIYQYCEYLSVQEKTFSESALRHLQCAKLCRDRLMSAVNGYEEQ